MTPHDHLQIDSIEAFLRRASLVDLPFMVKGSIITRQYFANPAIRKVADLDWVYLEFIDREEDAGKLFSDWAIQVTEMEVKDQVKFRSFKENDFWRSIDYAMNDDFPTVDTDLLCWVNGKLNDYLSLDLSYNLDIDYPPVEMWYTPRIGDPFILKNTCPLPLQVSWKLHQLLVRPREKDVFDLIHLLQHSQFDETVLHQTLKALKKECDRDKIAVNNLSKFVNGEVVEYFKLKELGRLKVENWSIFNTPLPELQYLSDLSIDRSRFFTYEDHFKYEKLAELFQALSEMLLQNGFQENLIQDL